MEEKYFTMYRLTNTKTKQVFEGRGISTVIIQAGLKPPYSAARFRQSKTWVLELIESPSVRDEPSYRKTLYNRTKDKYPEYEKRKRIRDPHFERAKRLRRNNWKNADGSTLTVEQYNTLLQQPCKVCEKTTDIVVDHCHATNVVRGPLCRTCNLALGYVNDDVDILRKLIVYLQTQGTNNGQT